MEIRICQREECFNDFVPRSHNSAYCCAECRKIEQNRKVLENYHKKRDKIKNPVKKKCSSKGCITILSQYNKEDICEACKSKRLDKRLKDWGWEDTAIADVLS